MGFSFRKSKKKKAAKEAVKKREATTEADAQKQSSGGTDKQGGTTAQRKHLPPDGQTFSSPLWSIDESRGDESGMPESPSSVLKTLNIVPSKEPGTLDTHGSSMYETDESLEVVVGSAGTALTEGSTSVDVAKEENGESKNEEKDITHADVRKILFSDDKEDDKEKEGKMDQTEEELKADQTKEEEGKTDQTTNAANVVTLEEQPFDAKAEFEVDEMEDLEKTLPSDFGRQNRADMLHTNVTRKLLDTFNCNEDTTKGPSGLRKIADAGILKVNGVSNMFYDNLCGAYFNGQKRPYYNEQFTLKFLQEITKTGIPLLYHQPPSDPNVEDWTGRSVSMFVIPGNSNGGKLLQPTLEWSTMGGGWSRTGTSKIITTSVDLLTIHSILDSSDVEEERDDDGAADDVCFFSITTKAGDVHVFEAQSYEERDRIVNGLKNVIARLAYHLVAGDVQVSTELYSEEDGLMSGELPSLRTPTQAMNDISHTFLD